MRRLPPRRLLGAAGLIGAVPAAVLLSLMLLGALAPGPGLLALLACGLGALLVASMLFFAGVIGTWSAHELLIALFLFLTAPISANMIAKVHLHRLRTGAIVEPNSVAGDPPHPGGEGDWAM